MYCIADLPYEGKGAVLMAAAYPNRTSPVLRGSFILTYLESVPPANPPKGVPTLDDKDIGTTKALTVRQMVAKHRANPSCSACRAVMDPLRSNAFPPMPLDFPAERIGNE